MASVDTFYRAKRAAALVNPTVETTFKQALDDTTKAIFTILPASGKLGLTSGPAQPTKVRISGEIVAGAAGNITLALRSGLTVAGTLLASSGAIAMGGAGNFNFNLELDELVWDAQSDTVRGIMKGHVAGVAVARAINSNPLTGFDPEGSTDIQICATALFSVSNAANSARVAEMVSETA